MKSNTFGTVRDAVREALALLSCFIRPKTFVYASAPITTGVHLFEELLGLEHPDAAFDGRPNKLLLRRVVASNEKDSHLFCEDLTNKYGNRVIDPSRLAKFSDWTQCDYNYLWRKIIEEQTNLVSFIDGWQFSSGCTFEFIVASKAGIKRQNAQGMTLTNPMAARLMKDSQAELLHLGFKASFLSERLQQLASSKALQDPAAIKRVISHSEATRLCASVVGCFAWRKDLTFVANPSNLTSRSIRTQRSRSGTLRGLLAQGTSALVVDPNILDSKKRLILDTSGFWVNIMKSYAKRLWMISGWQYDPRCVIYVYNAIRCGIILVDEKLTKITSGDALELVNNATREIERRGDSGEHASLVRALNRLKRVA